MVFPSPVTPTGAARRASMSKQRPTFEPDDEAVYRVSMLSLWLSDNPDDQEARSELSKWAWVMQMQEGLRGRKR